MKTIRLILKPGKEKPIQGRHPWIYSGAISQIDDDYETGDLVRVQSASGQFLGTGYLNPRSQIAVRMLSFEEEIIDKKFFEKRINAAIGLRERFVSPHPSPAGGGGEGETNAYRLIHSEGDFLPGLIVDRYGDYLVAQFQTAGMEKWKEIIVSILQEKTAPRGIYEKDDFETRQWEGLEKRVGLLTGVEPPDYIQIEEYGISFIVDVREGQKTGFFLDQRENRKLVSRFCEGKRVLNLFAYTGGFSVYAAKAGASRVTSVETERASEEFLAGEFRTLGRHTAVLFQDLAATVVHPVVPTVLTQAAGGATLYTQCNNKEETDYDQAPHHTRQQLGSHHRKADP